MEGTIFLLFFLLVLFQIKHYLADYPLQTDYMLRKFRQDGWVLPLLCHALIHGGFTLIIASAFAAPMVAISLAVFDTTIHFIMDRIKASPQIFGKYQPDEKPYWLALGLDQMVHHLTHYAIIFVIISSYIS
jgi:hypothetical protein